MEEDIKIEDIIDENDLLLNALVEILINKKIISEDELQKKMEELDSDE